MLVWGIPAWGRRSRGVRNRRPQDGSRLVATTLAWLALVSLAAATAACGGGDGAAPDGSASDSSVDSSSPDATGADSAIDGAATDSAVPPGEVSLFVAQGYAGRSLVSCDRGRSWVGDRSDDDSLRCFRDGFDCDHHPGAAKGITYGRGYFFATYGWGAEGSVRRSRDGVAWQSVLTGTQFGGIAYGAGRVVAGDPTVARWSEDLGETWNASDPGLGFSAHVRRMLFVDSASSFVMVGNRDDGDHLTISADGETWQQATTHPAPCSGPTEGGGGIASGNGAAVILYRSGSVCRSTDGSAWTASAMPTTPAEGDAYSYVVFADGQFWVWEGGSAYTSPDAETWTAAPIDPPNLRLGAVDYADGSFVGVRHGWQRDYEDQELYFSDDGLRWQPASIAGGHPISFITHGRGAASDVCP